MTKDSALAIAFRNFPEIKTTKYSISLHPTWFYSISITLHENEGKWFTVNAITGKVENGFWSSQE